jgi:hypothetical protein
MQPALLWGAVLLTVLPPVVDLLLSDRRRSFAYLAADAFYYLTVGRNIVSTGLVSFDQAHLTNGFHPLWQYFLAGLFRLQMSLGVPEFSLLTGIVLFNALIIGAGIYLVARTIQAALASPAPLLLTLPVGVYAFLVSPLWWSMSPEELSRQNRMEGSMPLYGTLWSYMNGMESSFVIFFFGLLTWFYVGRYPWVRPRCGIVFGFLLALLALSRLDHVFLAAPFLGLAAIRGFRSRAARASAWLAWTTVGVPLTVYVLTNILFFGSPLPISGVSKTSFPLMTPGGLDVISLLFRTWKANGEWLYLAWRMAQLLLPVFGALVFLLWCARNMQRGDAPTNEPPPDHRLDQFLALTAIAVLLLGAYDFLFVHPFYQGHWYFPMSVLWFSMVVIRVGDGWSRRHLAGRRWRQGAWVVAFFGLTLLYFVRFHGASDYHRKYSDFYFEEAPRIKNYYRGTEPKLYSRDDGIIAFSTGFPTMNGMGLMIDRDAVPYYRSHTQGDLAVARGYDRITSLEYVDYSWLDPRVPSSNLGLWIEHYFPIWKDSSRYAFTVDYHSDRGYFAIVKVDSIGSGHGK